MKPHQQSRGWQQWGLTTTRRPRGVVLIVALVCLGVASSLMVASTRQAVLARRQCRLHAQLRQTQLLLDAGIRLAVARIRQDTEYTGESWQPQGALPQFETALVEIRVSTVEGESTERKIEVLARLARNRSAASQTQRSYTWTHPTFASSPSSSPE